MRKCPVAFLVEWYTHSAFSELRNLSALTSSDTNSTMLTTTNYERGGCVSKHKSLFYQFQSAIDQSCFSKHFDKHAYKNQKDQAPQGWRIFGFSSRTNLLDTAHSLSKYIKEHYPDIRQVKQITGSICQEWLDSRTKNGCALTTVKAYQSNLTKLSKVINHHFGLHTSFEVKVNADLIPDRTSPREFALTADEIDRIKQSITKPSNSSNFFVFSTFTATRVNQVETLRVCDLSLHYDKEQDRYFVKTRFLGDKGGRDREIITEGKEFHTFCRTLVVGKEKTASLFGNIKADSANRWLNRRLKKLNIAIPQSKCIGGQRVMKSGNHSVRKSSIQAYYDRQYRFYIDQGHLPAKAAKIAQGDVCLRLGHSRNRADIVNIYLRSAS